MAAEQQSRTLQSEYLLPLLCFIRPLIYFWLAFFLFSWFLFVGYNASPFDLVQSIQFFRIPVITRLERRNKKNEREGEWVSERDCRRRFTEAKDIHISPTGSKWKKLVVFPVDMEWNASPSETSLRNGTDSQPDKKKNDAAVLDACTSPYSLARNHNLFKLSTGDVRSELLVPSLTWLLITLTKADVCQQTIAFFPRVQMFKTNSFLI